MNFEAFGSGDLIIFVVLTMIRFALAKAEKEVRAIIFARKSVSLAVVIS